jgi:hypothetical protein
MCFMFMYIDFASFYDISIIFWTCSDSMVFITLVFRFNIHGKLLNYFFDLSFKYTLFVFYRPKLLRR